MHRCAAQCCDRTDTSLDQNQECIGKCSQPIQLAQTFVESEVNQFQVCRHCLVVAIDRTNHVYYDQGRIERCVLDCQDKIKDKVNDRTSDAQLKTFTDQFQTCVVKCVDKHIDLMPNMLKKMVDTIKRGSYN